LYDLARAGVTVERKPRPITIYGLRLIGLEGGVARMGVACSEGTYVRTLCEDLGRAAGTFAHMGALLRDGAGPFILAESRTLVEIAADPEAALIAPEAIVPFPTIVLDARGSADFRAGRVVPLPGGATAKHVFVRDSSRTLVGVGESVGILLAPRKVFV
jgi:tRNA pseudouridine55 synthase